MKYIFTIILISLTCKIYSQNSSNIYNEKGQLLLDTNYTITENQLKKWSRNETTILHYISWNIKYPQIYRETGVEGYAIVSFDCDSSNSMKNITLHFESHDLFGNASVAGIKKAENNIISFLHNETDNTETYYIPVVFRLFNFEERINKYTALPIIQEKIRIISIDNYCPRGVRKKKD